MSADNGICVQQRNDNKWYVWQFFDEPEKSFPKPGDWNFFGSFSAEQQAIDAARKISEETSTEYGVVILPSELENAMEATIKIIKMLEDVAALIADGPVKKHLDNALAELLAAISAAKPEIGN